MSDRLGHKSFELSDFRIQIQISLPRPPPHYIFWLLLHLNFYQVLISSFYAQSPFLSRCLTERTHTRYPHRGIEASRPPVQVFSVVVREDRLDTLGCKSRFPDLAPPFTGVGGFLSLPPISSPPGRSASGSIPGRQWFWPAGPSIDALRLRRERGSQAARAARGTRQAPLLRPSQFCGGCGFGSTAGLPGPFVTEMANSPAVLPPDFEPHNLSFNPRFYLSNLLHFLTCTTEDKLLTLSSSACCEAEVEK